MVQPQRQHPNQGCKNTLEITAGLWCTTNTPNTVSEDLAPGAPTPAHPCCPCAAAPSFLHSRRFLYVREQNNSIKSPSCQLPALRDKQQIFLDEHLGGDAGHTTLSCLPYATQEETIPASSALGGSQTSGRTDSCASRTRKRLHLGANEQTLGGLGRGKASPQCAPSTPLPQRDAGRRGRSVSSSRPLHPAPARQLQRAIKV